MSDRKPKKLTETPQQEREKARVEYEKKTKGLLFTKDFYTRQEVLMRDPLATVGERVMAWILRRSWGEYVLYAMRDDGQPAYQRDCVRALGLSKKRVSEAVAYYQKRGYLEKQGKLLYPVISPRLVSPDPEAKKSGEYRTFLEEWKVTYSADFEEEKVLRSALKKKVEVRLSLYKKYLRGRKERAASLLETRESNSETDLRAAVSPLEASNLRHKQTPAQPPVEGGMQTKGQAADYLFAEIERMQKAHPGTAFSKPLIDKRNPGDIGLVNRILKELGSYDEQYIIGYTIHLVAKFKGWGMGGTKKAPREPGSATGPHSLGLLVEWAKDYARIAGGRS